MKKRQQIPFDAESLLREYDFKVTALRVLLLTILHDSSKPLTVSSIAKKVRKLDVDNATIYRALQAFVDEGLIVSLALTGKGQSYEFVHNKRHVHHIVCESCNSIEAIPFCVRGIEVNAQVKSKMFKSISSHVLSFGGTCKKCARAVR